MIDIALNARGAAVPGKAIAARLGLPARHLEPILQALARAGLLASSRGIGGGYELARERRRITLADIVAAVDTADPAPSNAAIDLALAAAEAALHDTLRRITLERLLKDIPPEARRDGDYHI